MPRLDMRNWLDFCTVVCLVIFTIFAGYVACWFVFGRR